jgi:MoxR-like ATPase
MLTSGEKGIRVPGEWRIYQNTNESPDNDVLDVAWEVPAPPWRDWPKTRGLPADSRFIGPPPGEFPEENYYKANRDIILTVNAALRLRRPILVTGAPGTGKTTLASSIAYELGLGPVLNWSITNRSTLSQGLYDYDVLGRVNDMNLADRAGKRAAESGGQADRDAASALHDDASDIGRYITLGPLGDALLPRPRPRVLLIDEIDKCDIDLPGDLLHVFERGSYEIPELVRERRQPVEVRCADGQRTVFIADGKVECCEFPLVVLTSNEERDFPPAFRRRCLHLQLKPPEEKALREIADKMLRRKLDPETGAEIGDFIKERGADGRELATDQLLNLLFLRIDGLNVEDLPQVRKIVLSQLGELAGD